MKRYLALVIALVMALALLPAGVSAAKGDDALSFSWWIPQGTDTSYYKSYSENPVVEWLMGQTWGAEGKTLSLEFLVPVGGAEQDNFNTLLATGDYPEIMNSTYLRSSIAELYEDGIVLDLTEYVEAYMPNYVAFLEANPELAKTTTNVVNGEKKYLQLWSYRDALAYNWGGYCYRRDWIVKYGVSPVDGSAFSGAYVATLEDGSTDKDSWEDNVVFPSGNADPVYISDWEWMLEIFARAIEDQGITDGYCMSLYYPGYTETGELSCAFGGGGVAWYKDKDDQIVFGATSDNFRVYLQCMYTWFQNGWIDKAFPEHSADMFYKIDDAKVRQGKVGLWYGLLGQLEGKLDDGEGLRDGMVVFGARQPINDIYGGEAQQGVEPFCMYQQAREAVSIFLTEKAKDKDIATLCSLLDYMYSQQGAINMMLGLNKEQYEETQNELYTRFGLTEGAYYALETPTGTKYTVVDEIQYSSGALNTAVNGVRLFGMEPSSITFTRGHASYLNCLDQWIWYENTGRLEGSFTSQLSPADAKAFAKVETNVREFLSKNVPSFIKGSKDPFSDKDWDAFVKALNKYGPEKNVKIYQTLLDQLK